MVTAGSGSAAALKLGSSFLALALCAATAAASSFTLHSDVDARKVGLEDQLRLTIAVEGSGAPDSIPLPALTNLQVVGGPFESSQISIVNGRISQSRSFTYLLRPRGLGKAEIGAVTAADQTAPAIVIEVVAGSVRPAEPQRRRDPFADPFDDTSEDPFQELLGRRRGASAEPKLMIEVLPSRTKLRVGEPLVLTYYLNTQVPVADLHFEEAPQYAGFWVEDIERDKSPASGTTVTVGGEPYRCFPIQQKLLFPTKTGTLTLPAATMRISVPRQGFFDTGAEVRRSTRPVQITVEPLPDGLGFSGAVGQFRVSATLDRDAIRLGDAATLRFLIQGVGNLKWIDRPPPIEIKGAKVYPPQVKSDFKATPQGINGSRTWEFVLVPESAGTIELPALAFSYFDPNPGRIVLAETKPLSLRVEGGTSTVSAPAPLPPTLNQNAGSGLPLRVSLDRKRHVLPTISGRHLSFFGALALLLHAGLWTATRIRRFIGGGRGQATAPRSVKAALRHLRKVGGHSMSKEQAAALIEKALHDTFGEIADSDQSERAGAVRALLEDVRFVRFAPQLGDYSEKTRELAAQAIATVKRWA